VDSVDTLVSFLTLAIKIQAKINKIETKKIIQRVNKTKIWFFENINKIDKPSANLIKGGGKRPKLIKTETKKGR
jgi:hypothetical protein